MVDGNSALQALQGQDETEDVERALVAQLATLLLATGPWYTLTDASRLTGVAYTTLRQACTDGRLPAVPVPGQGWMVRLQAIEARIGLHLQRGRPVALAEGITQQAGRAG